MKKAPANLVLIPAESRRWVIPRAERRFLLFRRSTLLQLATEFPLSEIEGSKLKAHKG